MAKKKRHSDAEISAKLAQASQLVEEGKTQSEIAGALGVSVMTFHRWRKAHPHRASTPPRQRQRFEPEMAPDRLEKIAALQLENSQLRRLVTDLLLEKVRLEETLGRPAKRG
jgi:putative transposase